MSTATVVVLLFGYHTSTSSTQASASPDSSVVAPVQGSTDSGTSSGSDSSSAASSAAPSSAAAGSAAAGTSGTVTGSVAQTRWGPVQVQLTVADGKITDVSVVEYPNSNGRDQ